jgi:serine/threonine protein phosphatase PrpC
MAEDLEPEIVEYRVHKGDWLFLATDGAYVHPLSDILLKIQSLQLNSDQSIQEINQSLSAAHYSDNVSIVLVII